jgi:ABC-type multidrug transport system fused ATPase/permease subunit
MKNATEPHNARNAYLFGLIRQYKRPILMILAIQAGCAVLMSLQPLFFQRIVSLAIKEASFALMPKGLTPIAALALIYLAVTLLRGFGGAIACRFSSDLLKQIQVAFFEKLNQLPLQYFQHQPAGEFMTKFNTDVSQTQALISHLMPTILRESAIILTVIIILFFSCPPGLTALAVLIVAVTAFLIVKLNGVLERYALEQRTRWADINRVLDETVQGIDTLKIFAGEKERNHYFQDKTASFRHLSVRAGLIASIFSPVIDLLSKFGGLFLVLAAYWMITRETVIIDQFLMFFFYVGLLEASVSALINTLSNIQPQMVSVGNLAVFFSQFSEGTEDQGTSLPIDKPLDIKISDLSFSYPGGRLLFNRANLFIPARNITVIHGPSGSGKSTLINLLLRFYAPETGEIRLDNLNISRFSREQLRKKISVVTQFHYIFNETLEQNLAIARPGASDKEIREALEKAQLGDFLGRLPKGLYEILDPRGKGLSGGERQRICIARLLLRKSPIIILDEPWSSLDVVPRELLIELINRWKSAATILILSHGLPPSLDVDLVYELLPQKGVFQVVKTREQDLTCSSGYMTKQ